MIFARNSVFNKAGRRRVASLALVVAAMTVAVTNLTAQGVNPTSASNAFYGSVTARPATDEVQKLSLDDAIALGLKNNLGLKVAENDELSLKGQKNQVLQQFYPTITARGDTGVHQLNLVTTGLVPLFKTLLPGTPMIARWELTEGVVDFHQTLFSRPVFFTWKATGAAERAASFTRIWDRGEVVQQVAKAYLQAIAAASEVENAKALEATDALLLSQAHTAHEAGTVSNLDELRARVQLQTQQQTLIAVQNSLEKDLILLKREIGVDSGQRIVLTDPAPYSELAAESPKKLRAFAYKNRQDYQSLQLQAVQFRAIHAAYRSQRLPSLSVGGSYAVSQVGGVGARGNFTAVGTLSVPLFREAKLRGDTQAAQANLDAVKAQLEDLRGQIDQQVRAALLDVGATAKLVDVAHSNVELATRALSDETARVNAGVDDNLPLVTAQSTLATAQSNQVESLYQYNISKLTLARAVGIIEQQYRDYLGRY